MSESSYLELASLFAAGLGLLALAGFTLLFRQASAITRVVAGVGVAAGTAVAPLALGASANIMPALVVGGVALGLTAISSVRTSRLVNGTLGFAGRPGGRAVVLTALGVGVAVAAAARVDLHEESITERDTAWMSDVTTKPQLRLATGVAAATDHGRPLNLCIPDEDRPLDRRTTAERRVLTELRMNERLIRLTPVSDDCNCHGWVFTGGRYWVSQDDVENILVENQYQPVSNPRVGDLVIYRSLGKVNHTAVVRAAGEGGLVLVEGKWGWMGVFLHPVGDSMYGKEYTFYRSPRHGHLVAGLDPSHGLVGGMAGE
jgi:hypothetical protein